MRHETFIEVERFIFGEIADGCSCDTIVSEVIEMFGNQANEEELTDLVYNIFEEF